MAELKDVCARFTRATNPNELGYTYEQLKSLDDIHVSLIPEKKGTLIKHNEYLVESRVSMNIINNWLFSDFRIYVETCIRIILSVYVSINVPF